MVLPLPPALLDVLLITNLLLATMLLLSALSVSDPIKLSALPTILLLATLFRLTLNISTTRLILSGGSAGHVIESFGSVVIAGSVIVGLVVFLIITLIQFIVIAKGAERIAEVAARFTLDALPGKQMSVDADVRSGVMDIEKARSKREELQIESRFYGALDGAMKFVKGDAIAGLIIVCVNIIGGITVGVLSQDLSVSHAFQKFVTLTIGDGLVSQIPALLNSLTAGIVVTKVARSDESSVVNELLAQIAQGHMVRGIVCAVSLVLACLPGMPIAPFVLVGLGILFLPRAELASVEPIAPIPNYAPRIPALWSVALPGQMPATLDLLNPQTPIFDTIRQQAFDSWGLMLPRIEVNGGTENKDHLHIHFRGGLIASYSPAEYADMTPEKFIDAFLGFIHLYRTETVDDVHTRRLLDFLEQGAPDLVSSVIPSVISVTQLTVVTRSLVRDSISLRHIDMIVQAVAESAARAPSDRLLLEEVRIALGRIIVGSLVAQQGSLRVIKLDSLLDLSLSEAERGARMVAPEIMVKLLEDIERTDSLYPILTTRGSRALLSDCLRARSVHRTVIAYEEVPQSVKVECVQCLELESDEAEALFDAHSSDNQGAYAV